MTISLYHLLQRRKISFTRWCEEQSILTQQDFQVAVSRIEQAGEYHISQELKDMALLLPLQPLHTPVTPPEPEPASELDSEPEIPKVAPKPTKKVKQP